MHTISVQLKFMKVCSLLALHGNLRTQLGFGGHFWRDLEAGVSSLLKEQYVRISWVEWTVQTADSPPGQKARWCSLLVTDGHELDHSPQGEIGGGGGKKLRGSPLRTNCLHSLFSSSDPVSILRELLSQLGGWEFGQGFLCGTQALLEQL